MPCCLTGAHLRYGQHDSERAHVTFVLYSPMDERVDVKPPFEGMRLKICRGLSMMEHSLC